jgi:hypothetical protein
MSYTSLVDKSYNQKNTKENHSRIRIENRVFKFLFFASNLVLFRQNILISSISSKLVPNVFI